MYGKVNWCETKVQRIKKKIDIQANANRILDLIKIINHKAIFLFNWPQCSASDEIKMFTFRPFIKEWNVLNSVC